jgi:hypothetical protein
MKLNYFLQASLADAQFFGGFLKFVDTAKLAVVIIGCG